jgi:hypothetical protein
MKIGEKEQKIRDRVIFVYNVIPQVIDVDRHVVYVELRQKDVERLNLSLEGIANDLGALVDRKVEVKAK